MNDILLLAPFHCIKIHRDFNKITYIYGYDFIKNLTVGFSITEFKKRTKISAADKIRPGFILNNSIDRFIGSIYLFNKEDNLIYETDINNIINFNYLINVHGFRFIKDKSTLTSFKVEGISKDNIFCSFPVL